MTAGTYPFPTIRQHAWDRLAPGSKAENPDSAIDGFVSLGEYDVELVPVYTSVEGDGPESYLADPRHLAIKRTDNGQIFDVVSSNYRLLGPSQFASLLDEHITDRPECFAHLRGGRMQICVYPLDTTSVMGDVDDHHLIFINDMSGYRAVRAIIGSYRGLCTNGLVYVDANGVGKIFHDRHIEANFTKWLTYIPDQAAKRIALMTEAYEELAKVSLTSIEYTVREIINRVYREPEPVNTFGPADVVAERERKYEQELAKILTIRGEALALYQGAGTGMDHPACQGTAWGLFQAFTELEEYRPGRNVAESNIAGQRQENKLRAYNIITDVLGIGRGN